jgi:hypothetical protein
MYISLILCYCKSHPTNSSILSPDAGTRRVSVRVLDSKLSKCLPQSPISISMKVMPMVCVLMIRHHFESLRSCVGWSGAEPVSPASSIGSLPPSPPLKPLNDPVPQLNPLELPRDELKELVGHRSDTSDSEDYDVVLYIQIRRSCAARAYDAHRLSG